MASARHGASSVEVYGFVGWIASFVSAAMFGLWAWLPESALHAMGVTYYPNKQWALILPAYLVVTVLCGFWAYESLNMMDVPPLTALRTVFDDRSKWVSDLNACSSAPGSTAQRIPPLVHLPPPMASAVLYGEHRPTDPKPCQAAQDLAQH